MRGPVATGADVTAHGGRLVAIGKPDDSVLTVVIVAVVVLILLVLLLRHLIRKRGGWRRFRRSVGRELTLTRRAFGEPLRAYRRHRRGVRALARQLSDPRGGLLVRRLFDAAAAALADVPGAVAHTVRLEPGWASVQIAARRLPEPPAPWETAVEPGPQRWELPLDEADALPPGRTRAGAVRPLPVAVGMADDSCVHVDLAAGPRLITVEGDTAARGLLFQALAAQLDRPGSGASAVVADGVHPQHRGRRLDALLTELETAAAPGGRSAAEEAGAREPDGIGEPGRTATTVVVCAAPTPDQARRLGALAASGAVVCLVDGRVAGHTWALRVDGRGRVTAPELDLDADSGPLGRAVVAAVRADRRRLRREPPSARPRPSRPEEPRPHLLDETTPLREQPTEPVVPTATGTDLLAEPATARERPTAASSTTRDD
ncbi:MULTISPECIES: hypothetical protein [Streptomyces]|uniref:Secreted protein n=1 Tax=Streptomyces caniscabiei TaxID=2746961 RepID=A0ABU4MQY8_9ACTN|nr:MULTISPECIES: hypothetical protein [Streptomyces]MBE4734096.1 hypothetical protein [Streptomyces caniscabiei]MBE4759296.1 hypothetical protein [Streptomyces caniscabiei]MBE4773361.1 hypothetical protein [Streptomyces caniscabiei]MBE4783748.1 hypothetical protein [Streptomyces caniscabiei]MBE4793052.1 hypothetical protein [Streptomyces caniscabiei]